MMGEIEKWFEPSPTGDFLFEPEPMSQFLGVTLGDVDGDYFGATSVAEDIAAVTNAIGQNVQGTITAVGDAKAGGGLSKTIGDTAIKIGIGLGVALAAYAILKR